MLVPNEGEVTYPDPLITSIVDDQPGFNGKNENKTTNWMDNMFLKQEGLATGVCCLRNGETPL